MPRVYTHLRRLLPPLFLLWALALLPAAGAKDPEPKWIRVSSTHFSVLTDAGEKNGREIVLRFEQMRGVFADLMMKTRVNRWTLLPSGPTRSISGSRLSIREGSSANAGSFWRAPTVTT